MTEQQHAGDALVARTEDRLADLESALHALSTSRARVTHPSGLVSVEVDLHGAMTDLTIAPSLTGVDAGELGRAVVEAAARAAELVSRRRERVMASLADQWNH